MTDFPDSWPVVEVRVGPYGGTNGESMEGERVHFEPRVKRLQLLDGTLIIRRTTIVTLDVNGEGTALLPVSDDPDLSVNGWTWRVREKFRFGQSYDIEVLTADVAAGIDLNDRAPVMPDEAFYEFTGPFRTEMEALRDEQIDFSNIDTSDDLLESLLKGTAGAGPKVRAQLAAMVLGHRRGAPGVEIVAAGAIRNPGTGWEPIVDTLHQCDLGVLDVVTGSANVNINFDAPAGKRVTAFAVTDETLAVQGFSVGPSFSDNMIQLTFGRNKLLTDELTWDGSAWQWAQGGRFAVASDAAGILTISHATLKGRGMRLEPRDGGGSPVVHYRPRLSSASGATSSPTEFKFGFRQPLIQWVQIGALSSAASAAALSFASSVTIAAGTSIKLDTGTSTEVTITTGGPSGAGPYTIPVPALAKAHASGVGVFQQQVVEQVITARTAAEANNLRAVLSRAWEGAVNPMTDITTALYGAHNVWFLVIAEPA